MDLSLPTDPGGDTSTEVPLGDSPELVKTSVEAARSAVLAARAGAGSRKMVLLAGAVLAAVALGAVGLSFAPGSAPPQPPVPTRIEPPRPPEPEPRPESIEAAPEPEVGRLKLSGVPARARVSVDGERVENLREEKVFPSGRHTVVVEMKGFQKFERSLELEPGQLLELKVVLKKIRRRR
jgi:hypothetical protein